MKIRVMQKHIKAGQQDEPESCPIALAVKESLGIDFASVGSSIVSLAKNGRNLKLPFEAKVFVRRFDEGKSVRPFTFEI